MHCLIFSTLGMQRPKTAIEKCYQKGTSVKILLVIKICFLIVALKIDNWIGLRLSNQNAEMSSERRKILRKSIFKGKNLQNLCQQNAGSATYYILTTLVRRLTFEILLIYGSRDLISQGLFWPYPHYSYEINFFPSWIYKKTRLLHQEVFEFFKKNYIHN